jgi:uncharacterized protein YfdQ (DUF2303 family)
MFTKDAIEKLSEAEAISAANREVTASNVVALPSDFELRDLEAKAPHRRRARGTMTTSTVADFAGYTETHAEDGATVFVNQDDMSATAVLNLGTPLEPGHADNRAKLQPKKTAAYIALQAVANGRAITQQAVAEFMEDWPGELEFFNAQSDKLTPSQAITAVRRITIEGLNRVESATQQLSAERSTFERIEAKGTDLIPTTIYFRCCPYVDFASRLFVLRLGIVTGAKDPAITLRVQNAEKHAEEMAAELASLVRGAVKDTPVLLGSYSPSA